MGTDMPIAINVEQLRFAPGGKRSFAPVSFEAAPGDIVALLGGPGSGKTAMLLALAGRMRGWRGSVTVCGHDAARAGRRVRQLVGLGLMRDVNDLTETLTAEQHVAEQRLFVPRRERSRRTDVLARVGLEQSGRVRVRDLDAEQRVRLGIALALVRDIRVLVVDDLDRELDSEQRVRILGLLRELAAEGLAVVVACIDRESAHETDHFVELRPAAAPAPAPAAACREEIGDAVA
jgi:ABC-type multidrug transport system ATPase subunit